MREILNTLPSKIERNHYNFNLFKEFLQKNDEESKKRLIFNSAREVPQRSQTKLFDSSEKLYTVTSKKIFDISLITYIKSNSLSDGDCFGEIALEKSSAKRSATVIVSEDTHFAVLFKNNYDLCIKEVYASVKKQNTNIIMSSQIFNYFNKAYFENHFFHQFKLSKSYKNEKIINEGSNADYICFIKCGEFNVSMDNSIVEMNQIILHIAKTLEKSEFAEKLDKEDRIKKMKLIKNSIYMENERVDVDLSFSGFMKEKRNIKILILQQNDIAGLNDYIINDKFKFSVESKTHNSEYWKIERTVNTL